jgi:hypothetical protein
MTPSTRSSVKIQQTAAGERRVIEGGESRRLPTEEMNDFVVQNSSMKQELDRCSAARTNVVLQIVMSTITVV